MQSTVFYRFLVGDSSGYDWHNIFTMMGVLEHTTVIAGTMKFIGQKQD